MAQLSTEDRQRVWRGLMRYWSDEHEPQPWSKDELQAAVNAADTWIDNNQVSYKNALPEPFATNATPEQKVMLFCIIAAMRVSVDFARKLLGEVD